MTSKPSKEREVGTKKRLVIVGLFLGMCMAHITSAQSLPPTPSEPILFTNDLKIGSIGDDVQRLQQYLNTNGFSLAESGFGSPGEETTYFGQLTKEALMRLQKHFAEEILTPLGLTHPTGNFYISTRTFVNNSLVQEVTPLPVVADAQQVLPKKKIKRSGSSSVYYYTVTPRGDDTISITPNNEQDVAGNSTQSFTVTADEGYTLSALVEGTCPEGSWAGSIYTTGEITESCSVIFASDINTYTVTLNGDNISPSGARTVSHGGTQSFTVEDGVGYGLGTIEGTCPEGSWVHATYTTGEITAPCSLDFTPASISAAIGSMITASENLFLRQNGNDFEYSLSGSDWSVSSLLPIIVNTGEGTLTVHLVGDFTVSSANSYIMIDSNDVTIQGETGKEGPTIINVDGVSNYPGFIRNGSDTVNGFENITISNIFVNAVDSTLAQDGGWLAQSYFGIGATNNEISECGSNGVIAEHGGGIVGARSSNVTISDCFSTGRILINAGGIVGALADTVTVRNSHSFGIIEVAAGGIFGGSAFDSIAQNTYSTGLINGDAGGIFGEAHDNPTVLNSYTSGFAISDGRGILAGSALDGVSNYSEANNGITIGWSDTNASSALTGVNTVWKLIGVNQPYRLLSFDASPYDDSTQTVNAGESSSSVFGYYDSCSIVSISGGDPDSYDEIRIDGDTGVVSTTNNVENGTYDILVFCESIHGTYTLSTLELTVN